MKDHEYSSERLGQIAARALRDPSSVPKEDIRALAASVLTQRPARPVNLEVVTKAATMSPDEQIKVLALTFALAAVELIKITLRREGGVDLTDQQVADLINNAVETAEAAMAATSNTHDERVQV